MPDDPFPLDLSGEVKHFAIDRDTKVALRAMSRGDLPDVARWRAAEHVRRWWSSDGEPTLAGVTSTYGADIDGTTPTRMWVVEANGRSIGFVRDYRIGDYPDYAIQGPEPDAVGVDFAIGEPTWTGRGIGADRLRTVSYGEERPKHDNAREETRRLNRRAAMIVRVQR
jgi:RimJ/RimL family protein N-acetyltransferase